MRATDPERPSGPEGSREKDALHLYSAFGLCIESEFELQGLAAGRRRADVAVRRADLGARVERLREARESYSWSPEETFLFWRGIGAFLVREGREILVDPASDADPGEIQIALLGPTVAALLAQRGHVLLHASAVAIDGAAVLFLGSTGWGKSTIAAALQRRGHPMVVDDLAAIRFDGDSALVLRGFPHTKLWPDSVAALGEDPESLPPIGADYVKRRRALTEGFYERDELHVGRMYVLAGGERPEVRPLPPAEAFVQLTVHSYGIRWFLKEANAGQFHRRIALARRIPMRSLHRSRDLSEIWELARLVESDAA